ncbi:Gfo/Idh/MocA family protein [Glaciecola siphonariae]|uniref:Gfo/Idh/MocA family protein n=1 Tax=Glaciecola siphonariae TaxID=521012 RepID=A0ABV9LZJ2_9ALTE
MTRTTKSNFASHAGFNSPWNPSGDRSGDRLGDRSDNASIQNKRRNFLKSAAATGAIATTLPLSSALASAFSAQSGNESASSTEGAYAGPQLNIGIIGVGSRGAGIASVLNDVPGMKVSAICDTLDFRLQAAKAYIKHEGYKSYTDFRQLLDDKGIDAVVIASPFSMHANMAKAAAQAGKAIYCEKTLSYGIDETRELAKAVSSSGVIFQTGHQHRNSPLVQQVRNYVRDGYLGKVIKIESQWNRNNNWRRTVPDPALERQINWRMYREYSGGLAAELCSHQIDFVNWITDSHPTRVMGMGGIDYWKDGRETYDNVNILTEYDTGLKASYTSLTSNTKDHRRMTLLGDKGSIVMYDDKAYVYSETRPEDLAGAVVDGVSGATMKAWQQQKGVAIDADGQDSTAYALAAFRDAIVEQKQPISSLKSGAQTAVVVQMALDAMDSGNTQHWRKDYDFV